MKRAGEAVTAVLFLMGAFAASAAENEGTAQAPPNAQAPTSVSEPPPPPPPAPLQVRPGIDDTASLAPGLPPARERVEALFKAAEVAFPPRAIVFAAFKSERRLEVYSRGKKRSDWRLVHRYPIWAASGAEGPKLMEGDRQVPEGVYAIESFHPKSKFHLALKLDYPNAFDRKMGKADKRKTLGGDIMIHGGAGSTGCLAMGDGAIEELYALAEVAGRRNVKVVIAPFDLRMNPSREPPRKPDWMAKIYDRVTDELAWLPPAIDPEPPAPVAVNAPVDTQGSAAASANAPADAASGSTGQAAADAK